MPRAILNGMLGVAAGLLLSSGAALSSTAGAVSAKPNTTCFDAAKFFAEKAQTKASIREDATDVQFHGDPGIPSNQQDRIAAMHAWDLLDLVHSQGATQMISQPSDSSYFLIEGDLVTTNRSDDGVSLSEKSIGASQSGCKSLTIHRRTYSIDAAQSTQEKLVLLDVSQVDPRLSYPLTIQSVGSNQLLITKTVEGWYSEISPPSDTPHTEEITTVLSFGPKGATLPRAAMSDRLSQQLLEATRDVLQRFESRLK